MPAARLPRGMTPALLLVALLPLSPPPPVTASEAKLVFLGDETKGVTLEVPEEHAARITVWVAAQAEAVKKVRVRILNLVRKEGPLPSGQQSALITVSPAGADTLGPGGKEFALSVNAAPGGTYQGSLVFSGGTGLRPLILPLSVTVSRPRLDIEPKGDPAATILRETSPFLTTAIEPLRFRVRDASGWNWPKRVSFSAGPLTWMEMPPEKKEVPTPRGLIPLPPMGFPLFLATENQPPTQGILKVELPAGRTADLLLNLPPLPRGPYTASLIVNPGPGEEIRMVRVNVRHAPGLAIAIVFIGVSLGWLRKRVEERAANADLGDQIDRLEQQAYESLAAEPWDPVREGPEESLQDKLFDILHEHLHRARNRFEVADYEGAKGLLQEVGPPLLAARRLQAADFRIRELDARLSAMKQALPQAPPGPLVAALQVFGGRVGAARAALEIQKQSYFGGSFSGEGPDLKDLEKALFDAEAQMAAAGIAPAIPELQPTPRIFIPPSMHVGDEVRFRIQFPGPPAGPIRWDFGDNRQGTGLQAVHAYQAPGEYEVVAWVEGGPAIAADRIRIEPLPGGRRIEVLANMRVIAALIALLIAAAAQFLLLYEPNETFGTSREYLGAFLVGFLVTETGNLGQDLLKRVGKWLSPRAAA